MEEAVSERCKTFAAAHRSNEDYQSYISASRRPSSINAKTKTETWLATCSSLLPKCNHKSVYSLLRFVAGSSSSSPNFPNCFSSRESASVFANYLRSHFSVSQPKILHSRARSYLSELRRATCPEVSHSSFASSFSPPNFLRLLLISPPPLPLAQTKLLCLLHAKAPSSLWQGSSIHFQSFLVFTFLFFHLKNIFHYSHP